MIYLPVSLGTVIATFLASFKVNAVTREIPINFTVNHGWLRSIHSQLLYPIRVYLYTRIHIHTYMYICLISRSRRFNFYFIFTLYK